MHKRIYRLPAAVLFSELSWIFVLLLLLLKIFFFFCCSFNKTKQRLSQRWWWGRFLFLSHRPSSCLVLFFSSLRSFSSFFEKIYVLTMRNRDYSFANKCNTHLRNNVARFQSHAYSFQWLAQLDKRFSLYLFRKHSKFTEIKHIWKLFLTFCTPKEKKKLHCIEIRWEKVKQKKRNKNKYSETWNFIRLW